jgi:hypothetical protein
MSFRQTETASVAAAKAGFSAATAYRIEQHLRLPSQKRSPRGRQRQDSLAAVWDSEVVPLLKSVPGLWRSPFSTRSAAVILKNGWNSLSLFSGGMPMPLSRMRISTAPPEISQSTPAGPPIDRFLATHSYYIAYVVPGGMYADNPDDVPTIGTQAVLIASSNQPDELSYAVVKAVIENFTDFRLLHPALSTLEIKDMVPSEAVMPIHPGALNYYREAGLVH